MDRHRHRTRLWKFLAVALGSIALLVGAAIPAAAEELMTITFIRHGESAGNASGLIDTSVPGPVLTAKGQQQAQAVALLLGDNTAVASVSSLKKDSAPAVTSLTDTKAPKLRSTDSIARSSLTVSWLTVE